MEVVMKKLILGALAATILASPLAIAPASAAPQQRTETRKVVRGPHGRTVVTNRTVVNRPNYRRWAKGQRFDSRYAQNYSQINNWQQYRGRRLYAPPRGYHWVRSGNDAVLVAVAGGVIGAVLAGAFN
jgi:Ni/Co efflux regulator RcnB